MGVKKNGPVEQMMDEKIKCERLLLRSLSLSEMEQIQNEDQIFLEKSVLTDVVKSAVSYKIEQMKKVPKEAHPWLNYWLITEIKGGCGIGLVGSKHLPDESGFVELGYGIAAKYRNRGFMTEALEGFLDWLYQFSFCSGAFLSIRAANLPSVKVAEKCGFSYEGMQDIYRVYRYRF